MSESKHTIYESRSSTHADDCWSWGPGHYKCAVREIERLRTENARLREDAARYRWLRDREIPEWLDLWHQNPDRIDAAIDAAQAQPKRRPYNASGSLSEYGVFPECDAAPAAQAPAANADALLDALRQIAEWPDGGERYGQEKIKRFAQHAIDAAMLKAREGER